MGTNSREGRITDIIQPAIRLTGADIVRTPATKLTTPMASAAFSAVKWVKNLVEKRYDELRAELIARAQADGKEDDDGHFRLIVSGYGALKAERRNKNTITKAYEAGVRALCVKHKVKPETCFDVIEVEQLNPEKLEQLAAAGKIPRGELEALAPPSFALKDDPAPALRALIEGGGA